MLLIEVILMAHIYLNPQCEGTKGPDVWPPLSVNGVIVHCETIEYIGSDLRPPTDGVDRPP